MSTTTFVPLGRLVATRSIVTLFPDARKLIPLIKRHASGDWGDVDDEDKQANDAALIHGTRLLSAYMLEGTKIWIITEADRSVTTILLPEDY